MPKIVGGIAKGRNIRIPHGDVRPATARARKSLFDYLSQIIPNSKVLDLYCGSGGLGLEAVSRGAEHSWFVDLSERSIRIARENAKSLGFQSSCTFHKRDVFKFLRNTGEYGIDDIDLIFAAPPYKIAEPDRILNEIAESTVLVRNGVVCLEYSKHTESLESHDFKLDRRKVYGETVLEIWDYLKA